jgi:glutamine synthetase
MSADWESLIVAIPETDRDVIALAAIDALGRLFGKRFTRASFLEQATSQFAVCSTNLTWGPDLVPIEGIGLSGGHNGYPNLWLRPDPERIFVAPWQSETLVLSDVVDEAGHPVDVSPRTVLRRQTEELRQSLGIVALVSVELEFVALRGASWRTGVPAFASPSNYSLLASREIDDLLSAIRTGLARACIPIEALATEAGNGQVECTLEPSEPLLAADRAAIFKSAVREIAREHGYAATFMAKPFADDAGNSGHVHLSLWRGESNVFAGGWDHPVGESSSAVAGVLELAPALCTFYAPNLNSYKRFRPGSFAPTSVGWGPDNRTVALRAIGNGNDARLEVRVPGADVCPHLVVAATLAALRFGLEEQLDAPPSVVGSAYEAEAHGSALPFTLEQAVRLTRESKRVRALLGDAVVDHYTRMAEGEMDAFVGSVTDWERDRYWTAV